MNRLIDKVKKGVLKGEIRQPFTTKDLKEWMEKYNVKKENGEGYSSSSIESLLSNTSIHNKDTSNLNDKMLCSRINKNGKQEYWFGELET